MGSLDFEKNMYLLITTLLESTVRVFIIVNEGLIII